MQYQWHLADVPSPDEVASLSDAININSYIAQILIQRGIRKFHEAKAYFRPSLDALHDPYLMKGMATAVNRLVHALENKQHILIYGDYDVDGTTSVAMVMDYLQALGARLSYYVPDRFSEGYGLSETAVDWAQEKDIDLVITIDCGIKANKQIARAVANGMEVIVCDHHLPGDLLPDAVAVLDPKQNGCAYPFKELSGCGVAFKLLQALNDRWGGKPGQLVRCLDLVAISIASDIVEITGENRILMYWGLRQLEATSRTGLKELKKAAGLNSQLSVNDIVFKIGPRINAAGRMAHARDAIKLFLSDQQEEAAVLAEHLNTYNETRRQADLTATEDALQMISESTGDRMSTVLFNPVWHNGVIGIVASRCIEKFYRPTIILTQQDEGVTGSARSIAGFDIAQAIGECEDLLDSYGGHVHAAGLRMSPDKVDMFIDRFEQVVRQHLAKELLIPELVIDVQVPLYMIGARFYSLIKQMAPFGPGNLNPCFLSTDVVIASTPRLLKEKHLKFWVSDMAGSVRLECLAFNRPEWAAELDKGSLVDLVYILDVNEFRGERFLQLMVKDLKTK